MNTLGRLSAVALASLHLFTTANALLDDSEQQAKVIDHRLNPIQNEWLHQSNQYMKLVDVSSKTGNAFNTNEPNV